MKKHIKIYLIFLFAFAFLFSFGNVRADSYDVTMNGIAGVGGRDECFKWSHVCIHNIAGLRISYYNNGSFKAGIDVYDSNQLGRNSFNKLMNKLDGSNGAYMTRNKKGVSVGERTWISIGFSDGIFGKKKDQKQSYGKIVSKFKNGTPLELRPYLIALGELPNGATSSDTLKYIKKHYKTAVFMIEPLYHVQIQTLQDASKVYYAEQRGQKAKTNWKHFIGTASNVAEKVVSYGKRGGCSGEYNKAYCSRKNKGHVSRIANSILLEKKQLGISKVKEAVRGKTTMQTVADYSKGYGVGIIKLHYEPSPPGTDPVTKAANTFCYKVDQYNDCDEQNQTSYMDKTTVEKEPSAKNEACKIDDKTYSQSMYGTKYETINEYCQVYCEPTREFSFSLPNINGSKFADIFGSSNSSSSQQDSFEVLTSGNMSCKVDFTYTYSLGDREAIGKIFGDSARGTVAEAELARAAVRFIEKRDEIRDNDEKGVYEKNPMQREKDIKLRKQYNEEYKSTLRRVRSRLEVCLGKTPDVSGFSIDEPTVTYDGEKMQLTESKDEETVCVNCEGMKALQLKDYSEACGGKKCNEYFCPDEAYTSSMDNEDYLSEFSGVCQIKQYQDEVLKRPEMDISLSKKYYVDAKYSYEFNKNSSKTSDAESKTTANGKYNTVGKLNEDVEKVCTPNLKTPSIGTDTDSDPTVPPEKTALDKELDIKVPKPICENTETGARIKYDPDAESCECPLGTIHAGDNPYNLILQQAETGKFDLNDSMTCASVRLKVCNNKSISGSESGYEPILGEDETTNIDGCLSAGIPFNVCYRTADFSATCTNGFGQVVSITNQVRKYMQRNNIQFEEGREDAIWKKATEKAIPEIYDCTCDKNSKKPEDFVYRTIKLGTKDVAFPGKDGKGRNPGSNWDDDTLIQKVITGTKDVYSKDPMYTIVLNSQTIRQIRRYNRSHNYDDFNLICNSNGSACISRFLNGENNGLSNVTGKCANVNQNNFYDMGCLNYELYERS